MQAERAVELQHAAVGTRRIERESAAQVAVLRIGVRSNGREPVERAAQDHEHEARLRIGGGVREPRERCEQRELNGGTEQGATIHVRHLL